MLKKIKSRNFTKKQKKILIGKLIFYTFQYKCAKAWIFITHGEIPEV